MANKKQKQNTLSNMGIEDKHRERERSKREHRDAADLKKKKKN
jgi:hypothetical protein